MFVIDKELLRPDTVYYPRSGPVLFTGDDLEEICRSSKALVASGRHPPIPLEHRDDAKPVKMSREDDLSELTRHNTGWVQDFFQKSDGSLWASLGIIDPDVAAKVKDGRIKYVSPEITPILPADGQVHRNVVTHVAITHQPVWAGQKPFYVPQDWVGDDGAVVPALARMSLVRGSPIRLSMADATPPEDVLEAIRLGYRIPGGKAGRGVWFRGDYFPSHIPQKSLKEADPDELRGLLRKLAGRHGQRVPRDFAGLLEPGEVKEYPAKVQNVPASHLDLHDELPPFHRPHKDGEPLLAWEEPMGGLTHAVTGHGLLKKLAGQEGATVPVVRVHAKSPYEARAAALMYHLHDGSADPEDLAGLFMDGADPKELRSALQESGTAPHEPVFHKAEFLAGLRPDDPDATLADKQPKQMSEAAEPKMESPETLFSFADGYDPEEHRWQHWLQGQFPDAGERAAFAAAHGKDRPATHEDFLARAANHKERFSNGGDPVDYFEMTKPKDEEKPKDEGKEKKEGGEEKSEKKDDAPAPKKDDAPAPKAAEHKFQSILKKLEKFKVHLDPDKIKSAEELVSELETALHALEGAGAADGTDMGMGGGEKPPTLEAEQGSMFMSLKSDNEALKKALLEKDHQVLSLEGSLTSMTFSLIEKDTDGLLQQGRCTKAKRDEWLAAMRSVASRQRFSLIDPSKSVEMASICAEIRMARTVPEGTFLPRTPQSTPAQDFHAMLFSNAPLPTNGNGTTRLSAEPNPHTTGGQALPDGMPEDPEKKAEFDLTWKKMRMSLGIKD